MLVLASASPRRRDLLGQAGYRFQVQAACVPETRMPEEGPIHLAMRLAREKAETVFAKHRGVETIADSLFVLGADTVVVCDGEIFGKPSDAMDAARMLQALSGRTHQVITGVALIAGCAEPPFVELASDLTHVTMQTLSAEEISHYIASGEPMDKAGAYAIQGYAARWISRIGGCYFNVVGLPVALVSSMLEGARRRCASVSQSSEGIFSAAGGDRQIAPDVALPPENGDTLPDLPDHRD